MKVKKYRVNESEIFNLHSMYEHLMAIRESGNDSDEILGRIEEVETLMDVAPYIGSLVTWPQLKRIREIRDERNAIRYNIALLNGADDRAAGYAIM